MPPDLAYVRPFILFPTDQSPPGQRTFVTSGGNRAGGNPSPPRRGPHRSARRSRPAPESDAQWQTVFLAPVSVALVAGRPGPPAPPASVAEQSFLANAARALTATASLPAQTVKVAPRRHPAGARNRQPGLSPWPGLAGNSPQKAAPASCRVTRPCRHDTRAAIVKRAHPGCRGENCGADCIAGGRGFAGVSRLRHHFQSPTGLRRPRHYRQALGPRGRCQAASRAHFGSGGEASGRSLPPPAQAVAGAKTRAPRHLFSAALGFRQDSVQQHRTQSLVSSRRPVRRRRSG